MKTWLTIILYTSTLYLQKCDRGSMLKSSGITVGGGGWSPFVNDIASCPFVDNSIHGNAMATTHITLFISITVVITGDLCLAVPSMIKHLPVAEYDQTLACCKVVNT